MVNRNEADWLHPLELLQDEVGMWSRKNFGDQHSQVLDLSLGSLLSLLGIIEGLGALEVADHHHHQRASIGQALISICEFSYREDIPLHHLGFVQPLHRRGTNSALVAIGKLCYATINHHQGTRGFDDLGTYRVELVKGLNELIVYLDRVAESIGEDLMTVVSDAFVEVSKRNWKERPETG